MNARFEMTALPLFALPVLAHASYGSVKAIIDAKIKANGVSSFIEHLLLPVTRR